jgi:hypothetical protein
MPFYPDTATFYVVMTDLFGRVIAAPGVLKPLTDGKVLLRMTVTEPDAVLIVDGRLNPPRFIPGPTGPGAAGDVSGQPDIGLRIPADVLHNVWLNRMRLRDAFMAGKMHLDTSPLRALGLLSSLTGMFRFTEQIYPQVLREHGMMK